MKLPHARKLIGTAVVRVAKRRRVPVEGPSSGFTTVPDGHNELTVEVYVDVAAVAWNCADRLDRSKAGRSKLAHGAIECVAVKTVHVPEAGQ